MIYFLRRADGAIKIGTTEKYYARRSALASEFGDLQLLGTMGGGREVERELHELFSQERIRSKRKTEWFLPSQELLDYIAKHTTKEVQTARDTTIRLSYETFIFLKSFQNRHFIKTGDHLSNDEAIVLAVQLANLTATELRQDLSRINNHQSSRD